MRTRFNVTPQACIATLIVGCLAGIAGGFAGGWVAGGAQREAKAEIERLAGELAQANDKVCAVQAEMKEKAESRALTSSHEANGKIATPRDTYGTNLAELDKFENKLKTVESRLVVTIDRLKLIEDRQGSQIATDEVQLCLIKDIAIVVALLYKSQMTSDSTEPAPDNSVTSVIETLSKITTPIGGLKNKDVAPPPGKSPLDLLKKATEQLKTLASTRKSD